VDVTFGKKLLRAMLLASLSEGIEEVRFGEDGEHLFCGLPVEFGVQREALLATGFNVDSGEERVDLLARLKQQQEDTRVETRWILPGDRKRQEEFVAKEFPGRWASDVCWMNAQAGEQPCAVGLYEKGELIGFAVAQIEGLPFRCGGANWSQVLGKGWSALGPLGVAKSHRKGGYGRALMVGAMQRLLEAGSDRCIVDWTSLTQFYERFGFRIWKRYLSCAIDGSTWHDKGVG
jgi:GNAT superfamily N-acetyltransferase